MNLADAANRKATYYSLLLAMILLGVSGAFPCFGGQDEAKIQSLEGGYKVLVPAATNVSILDPAEDFVVYALSNAADGKFLTIYMGNQPHTNLPGNAHFRMMDITLAGYKTKILKWDDDKGGHCGSVNVSLGGNWPQVARFSYLGVTAKQEVAIEKIIGSFSSTKNQKENQGHPPIP